jgi:hypothetical protein
MRTAAWLAGVTLAAAVCWFGSELVSAAAVPEKALWPEHDVSVVLPTSLPPGVPTVLPSNLPERYKTNPLPTRPPISR